MPRPAMRFFLPLLLALLLAAPAAAQEAPPPEGARARLKDLVTLQGAQPVQLVGYGLVVGLDRTGDRASGRRGAVYTVESIANMLEQFGITVDPSQLASRNVAAVMVTATLDPYGAPGSRLDATVSALGDARSLSGGVLLQTPLTDALTGRVYALAQGPVSTGAVLAASGGASVKVGYTNTGRVPGGALVTLAPPTRLSEEQLGLVLRRPDFTNAARVAEAVNAAFPEAARVVHAGLVEVAVPEGRGAALMMAALEDLAVSVDVAARVVINERTGTVVAGGGVGISPLMLTYGSLVISTQTDTFASQPLPFSQGETTRETTSTASIAESGARTVVLPAAADVTQLAAALNALGLTARDVVAIFQAIDRAGALQGELVIL